MKQIKGNYKKVVQTLFIKMWRSREIKLEASSPERYL